MQIAITGITGFLGYHLAKKLSFDDDITIKALVRKESDLTQLNSFSSKIKFVYGELGDIESSAELVNNVDAIIHTAYDRKNGGFTESEFSDRNEFLDVNLIGSHTLLEQTKLAGVKKFIFTSSCAVFGAIEPDLALDERHPLKPDSIYGAYKASVESLCHAYALREGLETIMFRPVAIYGEHPVLEKSRWFNLIKDIKQGNDVNVSGGGKVVHVEDVVYALELALKKQISAGSVYALVDLFIDNMGIARMAKDIFGSKSNISGDGKTAKHLMVNDKAKMLGVNFKGEDGLKSYISELSI